jgi:hypothetical protein
MTSKDWPAYPDGRSYLITFSSDPDATEILALPNGFMSSPSNGAELFRYRKGLLLDEEENISYARNAKGQFVEMRFQKSLPLSPPENSPPRTDVLWSVVRMDMNGVTGVESAVGRPSKSFAGTIASRR